MRDGDAVCDTPPDGTRAAVPCDFTVNSCSTDTDSGFTTDQEDLFDNYMDYGRQACRLSFTQGQAQRMVFFLDNRRESLTRSLACSVPCPTPITAAFDGGDVTVEVGSSITFVNQSTNGDTFRWLVDGAPARTTRDYTRLFSDEGFFRVTLIVESNDPLCAGDEVTQTVRVVCSGRTGFTVPDSIVSGTQVTFVNTGTITVSESWAVNGTPAPAGSRDLEFTFTSSGIYEVCLTTNFGFCGDTVCRLVYVSRPPCVGPDCPDRGGACSPPFAAGFQFGDDRPSPEFSTVLPVLTGYFIGGSNDQGPYVAFLNLDLDPVWQTQLYPEQNAGVIIDMLTDGTG